jgi:hypothetical protein
VFENKVPRRIYDPKRKEVTEGQRKLHDAELQNCYSSPNISKVIKSRGMRWTGHVASIRRDEKCIENFSC